mmetsp:Transcript_6058/g.9149  ORF Transcript_6058/g.9149 Transcript_6058/m.9149 type:complete len:242 (-) Transcript_6058:167-892(-)
MFSHWRGERIHSLSCHDCGKIQLIRIGEILYRPHHAIVILFPMHAGTCGQRRHGHQGCILNLLHDRSLSFRGGGGVVIDTRRGSLRKRDFGRFARGFHHPQGRHAWRCRCCRLGCLKSLVRRKQFLSTLRLFVGFRSVAFENIVGLVEGFHEIGVQFQMIGERPWLGQGDHGVLQHIRVGVVVGSLFEESVLQSSSQVLCNHNVAPMVVHDIGRQLDLVLPIVVVEIVRNVGVQNGGPPVG